MLACPVVPAVRPRASHRISTYTAISIIAWASAVLADPQVAPSTSPPALLPPPAIVNVALVNADTGVVISPFDPLIAGATLEIGALAATSLSVLVDVDPAAGAVVAFELDGEVIHHDDHAPFTLLGENRAGLVGWTPEVGPHTLAVTPYQVIGAARIAGNRVEIPFDVTFAEVHVNAGGDAYIDGAGELWSASAGFQGGVAAQYSGEVAGTEEDTLYHSQVEGDLLPFQWYAPPGTYEVSLLFAEHVAVAEGERVFDVRIEGELAHPAVDVLAAAGPATAYGLFAEVAVTDGVLDIEIERSAGASALPAMISAVAIHGHSESGGDPYLHVVIEDPGMIVDYDKDGVEAVVLDGSKSHTHEPAHELNTLTWRDVSTGVVIGSGPILSIALPIGAHDIELTISDDHTPPSSLSATKTIFVDPIDQVRGSLSHYYDATDLDLFALLDDVPAMPDYVSPLDGLQVHELLGSVGGSPYQGDVLVVIIATVMVSKAGTYDVFASGGNDRRLFIDAAPVTDSQVLAAGPHQIEARFAIVDPSTLPAKVVVSAGGVVDPIEDVLEVHHDETLLAPFINALPAQGSALGGESVTIEGYGFFPESTVKVRWGNSVFSGPDLAVTPMKVELQSPPGTGTVEVRVETANGVSNSKAYAYDASAVPVSFHADPDKQLWVLATGTQAAWGPDGRLYIAERGGGIFAYRFDDEYHEMPPRQSIQSVLALPNHDITGIAFNPMDPPDPVRLYVSHTQHYAHADAPCTVDTDFDGEADTADVTAAYPGQVSVLMGPDFDTVVPIVTGLPTSNYDHAPNGIEFDCCGNLLIAIGGNTNAGVTGCALGGFPETPLSGGVLVCELWRPDFGGVIHYVETASGAPNDDQTVGHLVDVQPGIDVAVLASGLRNPYDLVYTTRGRLYATDNGPNQGYGKMSLSATLSGGEAVSADELVRVTEGDYLGHPNRNRGRFDGRQNVYHPPEESSVPGDFTAPLAILPQSCDGITEYRATTFNRGMLGRLLVQRWNGSVYSVRLDDDGSEVVDIAEPLVDCGALDVVTGPGGAILGLDYTGKKLRVFEPQDPTAVGSTAFDVYPWRARNDGVQPFVIGGVLFQGETTVTFGGVPAAVVSVSPTRIGGLIPANPSANADLLDVVVTSGGVTSVLPDAFRYVFEPGEGEGTWSAADDTPIALGGAAAGAIRAVVYLLPDGAPATWAYHVPSGTWHSDLASGRLDAGSQHAAAVLDDRMFVMGGQGGAENRLQIFDPTADPQWSYGTNLPFATAGAGAVACGRQIYLLGGESAGAPTDQAAVYDPALDQWQTLPPLPAPRSHASCGTDGERVFVFGGYAPPAAGEVSGVATDDAFVYDPATGAWESSSGPTASLSPLPTSLAGAGPAAYWCGELYVFGGVDAGGSVVGSGFAFRPETGTWRAERDMPTPRSGAAVVTQDRMIWTLGGSLAGGAPSAVVERFAR